MTDGHDSASGIVAATIARGEAFIRKGKYRRAIRLWRSLLESELDEIEPARASIRSKIASAYYQLAQIALRRSGRQNLRRAAERLRLALRYDNRLEYAIELARCHLRLGQLQRADEMLTHVLKTEPSNEKGLYYATVTKIRLGDFSAAHRLSERGCLAPSPLQGWWQRLQSLAAAAQEDFSQALALARSLLKLIPPSVWLSDILAITKASTPGADVASALDAVLQALREHGRQAPELKALAGDMQAHLGNYESAVRHWASAAAETKDRSLMTKVARVLEHQVVQALQERALQRAVEWYRLGVECGVEKAIKPLESVISFHQAQASWKRRDYHTAVAKFTACLQRRRSVDIARFLAISHEALGDWVSAAAAWQTVYELATGERPEMMLEAARRQGLAYLRAGAYEKANGALSRSLEIDTDDEIYLYLGCSLIQLGDVQAATNLFSKALEDGGENPRLLIGLAIAMELAERGLEERVAAWRRASMASDEPWVYRFWRRRHLELARHRLEAGQWDRALEGFIALLAQDLDDGEGWAWCGAVHLKRGRREIAQKCFDHALRVSATGETALMIGEHLLQSGEEKAAREYVDRAVELDPSPTTELAIARMCLKRGRRADTMHYLRRALGRSARGEPHLAEIAHLAVLAGEGETGRRLLADLTKLSDDTPFAQLLLAAEEIRLGRYKEAAEGIQRVEEKVLVTHDLRLAADTAYFHKALQRAMASRNLDEKEFRSRQEALAIRWVQQVNPSHLRPDDEKEQLLAWTRRQLYIAEALDPRDSEAVETAEIPLPPTELPKLFSFGRPLPLLRLLAHEPDWDRMGRRVSGRDGGPS